MGERREVLGEVRPDTLRAASPNGTAEVAEAVTPFPAVVSADLMLDEVLELLTTHERRWLPVVDGPGGRVLGAIDARTILRSYRHAADAHVRPLAPVAEEIHTFEFRISRRSPVEGSTLAELELPAGVRVLTIKRGGTVIVPMGSTRLLEEDTITVAVPAGAEALVMNMLLGG